MKLRLFALLSGGGYWYFGDRTPQVSPTSEQLVLVAATNGCYGAGCNGKNPSGLCDDGITVGAMGVEGGVLELRYSRSCAANWGRFTQYRREIRTLYPRMTVWNPGKQSYGLAHLSFRKSSSSWTQMTDGRQRACTGIEVVAVHQGGNDYEISDTFPEPGFDASGTNESYGWAWGPCR